MCSVSRNVSEWACKYQSSKLVKIPSSFNVTLNREHKLSIRIPSTPEPPCLSGHIQVQSCESAKTTRGSWSARGMRPDWQCNLPQAYREQDIRPIRLHLQKHTGRKTSETRRM
ncbi:hypothetical protein JZ751_009552 [Albula glossodonta]|uniref:Uncharacterized protein n=1 Tax=Albula glossodonta TaxID=121402 RepID=A0A8T2P5X9_9TELE|nr:hypothetical protein JZ751_009552 [Albula glossodonta]